ncbi:substrate-binding domain-containing protein [Reinekea marinisedimentorum]|uniref:Phosphate transport system substrate-binding protein n=1 Tax=Reinekea marinisedimentorum TaxID=230495 RepID=A0A4R3HY21_9GAMM|nr:substrate-binding domain-containing protein [Reinekea marinisedimentorum]TCS38092.1 phosphate transport system substrate-binding protein [Reinekea marinisedimentorum]
MKKTIFAAILATTATMAAVPSFARDQISIVGSSTVYPFATVVAERFGKATSYATPTIESTGSGGGLKLFCEGVGENTPDITNSSSYIKQSQFDACAEKGIDIIEVKIGYDGIALANSKKGVKLDVTQKDLFLALAAEVPDASGKLIANPNKTWKDVNPSLPNVAIRVLGPPPTSGTRAAFVELVMEEGCEAYEGLSDEVCTSMREDGAFVEAGENDNLIVQKLDADTTAYGIFGYSFLDQNSDKLQGASFNGVDITFDNIADGSYPVSRPLHFFIKKQHIGVIPGVLEYAELFLSPAAQAEDGYLAEKGLIPLGGAELKEMRKAVQTQKVLVMN